MLNGGAINNFGQAPFSTNRTGWQPGGVTRMWDNGQVSTFFGYNPNQVVGAGSSSLRGQFPDAATVADQLEQTQASHSRQRWQWSGRW